MNFQLIKYYNVRTFIQDRCCKVKSCNQLPELSPPILEEREMLVLQSIKPVLKKGGLGMLWSANLKTSGFPVAFMHLP